MVSSKSVIFSSYPKTYPEPGKHLTISSADVSLSSPPSDGLILKVLLVSVDPYMRGRMKDPGHGAFSYSAGFEIGKPIYGYGIAKVEKSNNQNFPEGTIVRGMIKHSEYVVVEEADIKSSNLQKLDNEYGLPLERFVGVLGMPGLTA